MWSGGCLRRLPAIYNAREYVTARSTKAYAIWACRGAKHNFHDFYIPAIPALLSCLETVAGSPELFAITAVFSVRGAAVFYQDMVQVSKNMQADEQTILALPLRPTEARLWTYRTASKYFAKELALFDALQDYVHQQEPITKDYSSYANVARAYRCIIFDRKYHPTADMIRQDAARGEGGHQPQHNNGSQPERIQLLCIIPLPPRKTLPVHLCPALTGTTEMTMLRDVSKANSSRTVSLSKSSPRKRRQFLIPDVRGMFRIMKTRPKA
jgi:hypothetical protein